MNNDIVRHNSKTISLNHQQISAKLKDLVIDQKLSLKINAMFQFLYT